CFAPEWRTGDLTASVGDHLVYVHVELGAAAGHPHMQREHVMMLPGEDLVTSLSNKVVLLIAQPLSGMVSRRSAFLQSGVSRNHLTRNQVFADAKMFQRALSLSAPELVRGYFNQAETICFLSHLGHESFSLLPVLGFDFRSSISQVQLRVTPSKAPAPAPRTVRSTLLRSARCDRALARFASRPYPSRSR